MMLPSSSEFGEYVPVVVQIQSPHMSDFDVPLRPTLWVTYCYKQSLYKRLVSLPDANKSHSPLYIYT